MSEFIKKPIFWYCAKVVLSVVVAVLGTKTMGFDPSLVILFIVMIFSADIGEALQSWAEWRHKRRRDRRRAIEHQEPHG